MLGNHTEVSEMNSGQERGAVSGWFLSEKNSGQERGAVSGWSLSEKLFSPLLTSVDVDTGAGEDGVTFVF